MSMKDEWAVDHTNDKSIVYGADRPVWHRKTTEVRDAHYKGVTTEVWDIVDELGLSWLSGNVLKYIQRHKKKDRLDDLLKAFDYLLKEMLNNYDVSFQDLEPFLKRHVDVPTSSGTELPEELK